VIRVADVPTPAVSRTRLEQFLAASRAAHGQTVAEVVATHQGRQAEIERLVRGRGAPSEEEDDGSIA
jgi:hypothetical protein